MNKQLEILRNQIQKIKAGRGEVLILPAEFFALADQDKDELIEQISRLEQLKVLDLTNNKLTALPDWLSNLTNLTTLDLSNNELTALPDWLANLTNLTVLYLTGNKLTALPDWLANLTNLTDLDLSFVLTALPDWLANLTNLTALYLGGNKLTALPDWLANLTNLTALDLSHNELTALPDWLANLTNLTKLYLWSNQIQRIPPDILKLKQLNILDLYNNPIEEPPLAVVEQGIEAIRDYFRQAAEQGLVPIYEAKLLIVGEPGAGKTSLAKKLQNRKYVLKKEGTKNKEKSTEGIEVIQMYFTLEDGKPFRVNIWDFGGQEIYHATHQFFLTTSSLYFLVADNRKEDTDFYYWLSVVELLSDNSPMLIIKNEKQDRKREISEQQLRGQFSNLKETLATNLDTNRGLDAIEAELKHYISRLPHVKKLLPKSWVRVREALDGDPRNYISLDEYLEICQQNGFSRREDKLQLSRYLHILGTCLHFQDDQLLNKTVILKPRWGTDAAYRVLDNERVKRQAGRFNERDLAEIWNDPQYENMHGELLRLMINFKLCYQIPNTKRYIAPQWLSPNQPAYDWDESDNLVLRYTYEFMPKGIITQFIVAMHRFIAGHDLVWRSGVVLEKNDTRAEVIETYGKQEIRIRVAGKQKKELLTIVAYKLDEIHASYERLRYSQWIPCNCPQCKASSEPNSYPFATLRQFQLERRDTIQCYKSYEMVSVWGLIDDVVDERWLPDQVERLARSQDEKGGKALSAHQVSIGTAYFQVADRGNFVNPRTEEGDIIMPREKPPKIKSAWANGSFYLFVFAVVIAALGVLGRSVPVYVLPMILIAAVVFVPIIGALQLRQDDRLKTKPFMELMKLAIGQLPLLSRFAKTGNDEQLEE
ncbi:MAG: COR domain-containing protein [Blastocatellia bacterium]